MKIAIFHNFMDNIGGAEIVALTLTQELQADLYTTSIDKEKIIKMGFEDVIKNIYSIGKIPKKAPFRQQLALFKFRKLDISKKYDLFIIAGDWAMSAAVNHHPNIWYVHSPLNELWEFKDFIKNKVIASWKKPFYEVWVNYNRRLTLKYASRVNKWVCNSQNTRKRVEKFYHQDAVVVYPPALINHFRKTEQTNSSFPYWLSVNRLITHKRIELQLEAFASLPDSNLIIVGSYEKGVTQFEKYRTLLENMRPKNVIIKHWVDKAELTQLYANCVGLITTAKNEDFGMTPVEAMACGKPVIAPLEGGYKESIINHKTGQLLSSINSEKIIKAIKEIETNISLDPEFYTNNCRERAKLFGVDVFIKQMKKVISEASKAQLDYEK